MHCAVTASGSHQLQKRRLNGNAGPPSPFPAVGQDGSEDDASKSESKASPNWKSTCLKMFESAATTFASIFILGLAGYSYHKYYKFVIIQKMEKAFKPGDPVLELTAMDKEPPNKTDELGWIRQYEQSKIENIINGTDTGHYFLLVGEKGTGKTSMLLKSIANINGEGIAMFEAHADLEIFRIRLGKALDYEFHEDYVGSLFSIRGPREGALLDIERAFNKLEKVAIRRREKIGRPLVLIINSTHLLRDDEDGRDLLELIQQRAEQWAASNLATVVMNSDDYWVYERLKQYATRMEVLPVLDLPKNQAIAALQGFRKKFTSIEASEEELEEAYDWVGGRLTFLSRVAKAENMLDACKQICQVEKTWFLNNCWILGAGMDDDVMDQQKYASAAMVLAKALVDQAKKEDSLYDTKFGHILPQIPLHKAREIMTRADFIKDYDHNNIFTIDAQAMVRADSVPMQNAFKEICSEPGFEEHLEATIQRIGDIESLGRTREVVAKDLISGRYKISGRADQHNGLAIEVQRDVPK